MDGFRAQGWNATDLVLPQDGGFTLVQTSGRIERGEFKLILSVQEMGLFGGPGVDAIMAKGGVRRLYWALDYPYSCWTSVAGLAASSIVSYPTAGHLGCARQHLRGDVTLLTLAHAAKRREPLPWQDRTIEALFVGNAPAADPESMRASWATRYPQPWSGVLEEMAERFDPLRTDALDALAREAVEARGYDSTRIDRNNFMVLIATFDQYAWTRTRFAYLDAMRDLPITLVGRGWEPFAGGAAKILGPMPTEQSRALMAQSKLVLNLQPRWFRSHERVFEGMAAGCAVATTGPGTIANAIGAESDPADETAVVCLGPPAEAAAHLRALLGDEPRLRALADAGLAEQRARHTWAHRVGALLRALDAA